MSKKLAPAKAAKQPRATRTQALAPTSGEVGNVLPVDSPDLAAFEEGVLMTGVTDEAEKTRLAEEAQDVSARLAAIDEVRDFDREAYAQIARDRSYARGDSTFAIKVNVIGSYIDTWDAVLYARNPDIDVTPVEGLDETVPPDQMAWSKTLELVIRRLLMRGGLKRNAKPWVRTALSTKFGCLKVTWQERAGKDPVTSKDIDDMQQNLARIAALEAEAAQGVCDPTSEAYINEMEQLHQGLEDEVEVLVAKGLCIDPVDPTDMTVSLSAPSILRFADGPWVSHRMFMHWHDASAQFPDIPKEKLKACATFAPRKPTKVNDPGLHSFTADQADLYSGGPTPGTKLGKCDYVCIEEVWDKDKNLVVTLMRGLDRYPKQPFTPSPTSLAFYPFHFLSFCPVDGERWPQSPNERSQSLQDEFNRVRSSFSEVRRRTKLKQAFNAHGLSRTEAKKVTDGVDIELLALKPLDPKADINTLIANLPIPNIPEFLYAVEPILASFELVWGMQEAMTATLNTAKTATEAEIQQSGTLARTGSKRDTLEDGLTEIAQQTGEYAMQKLSLAEVQDMCGVSAMWLEGADIEDIYQLVNIEIRAGSSGKPNTQQQRESWNETAGLIGGAVQQVAQLRGSNPLDTANCIIELVKETLARSGERVDVTRFFPPVPQPDDPWVIAQQMAAQGIVAPPGGGGGAPPPAGPPQDPGAIPTDPGHPAA